MMAAWLFSTMYLGTSPSLAFFFFVRKSTVKLFYSTSSHWYFSLMRMDLMVDACQTVLPQGVRMPSSFSRFVMAEGVMPSMNSR